MDKERIAQITRYLGRNEIGEVLDLIPPAEWDEAVKIAFELVAAEEIDKGVALQLRRNAQLRRDMISKIETIPADQIAPGKLNEWLQANRIFTVKHGDRILVPAFQLNAARDGEPFPIVGDVLKLLRSKGKRDWPVFAWWVAGNGWLGGLQPMKLMHSAPAGVLEAARHRVSEAYF